MFSIPVKVVEISGGGEGLPLMTWNPSDVYVPDLENVVFTNLNKTIEGEYATVRSNHPIVPDRWYLEMELTDLTVSAGGYERFLLGVTTDAYTLDMYSSYQDQSWVFTKWSGSGVSFVETEYGPPVVFAKNDAQLRLLSTDGMAYLESFIEGDVVQFAGRQSTGALWIGLNGVWLYSGVEVSESLVWSLGNPETEANPVFSNLPSEVFAFSKGGDDGDGGAWVDQFTLLTHIDDLVYTPPTGFSAVSGEATVTYLHVLRDRNLMPISQPTDHAMMGVLGL